MQTFPGQTLRALSTKQQYSHLKPGGGGIENYATTVSIGDNHVALSPILCEPVNRWPDRVKGEVGSLSI